MSSETSSAFEAGRELARSTPGAAEQTKRRESEQGGRGEPRVRFRSTGGGYAYVAETTPHAGRERPVYLHRLAAVAWGILDGLDDARHVHHCEHSVPLLNVEDNLAAEKPEDHYAHHLGGGQS